MHPVPIHILLCCFNWSRSTYSSVASIGPDPHAPLPLQLNQIDVIIHRFNWTRFTYPPAASIGPDSHTPLLLQLDQIQIIHCCFNWTRSTYSSAASIGPDPHTPLLPQLDPIDITPAAAAGSKSHHGHHRCQLVTLTRLSTPPLCLSRPTTTQQLHRAVSSPTARGLKQKRAPRQSQRRVPC